MSLPLAGVKVIELATWAALPGGGAILADWGADVIKIDDPRAPDPLRGFAQGAGGDDHPNLAPSFEQKNRNKRAIGLDVSQDNGQNVLRTLLKSADVFITSMRPNTLRKYGIDYPSLEKINEGLVMVHLSGFGQKGPDSDRPGFDALCFWARAGFARALAPANSPPIGQRPAQGDVTTSIAIAAGACAALFDRSRTGKGKEVLASLFGTGLWVAGGDLSTAFASGEDVKKIGNQHSANPLVGSYQIADGWIQLVNLHSERFWEPMCRALGREDLIGDQRYDSLEKRVKNGVELVRLFQDEFVKRTLAEWEPRLDAEEIRWGKIQTVLEATGDEQAWANDYYQQVKHPEAGDITLVSSPLQFGGEASPIKTAAPGIGQNTEEVLLEAGFNPADIDQYRRDKVII